MKKKYMENFLTDLIIFSMRAKRYRKIWCSSNFQNFLIKLKFCQGLQLNYLKNVFLLFICMYKSQKIIVYFQLSITQTSYFCYEKIDSKLIE